jgi:hypothetical protein
MARPIRLLSKTNYIILVDYEKSNLWVKVYQMSQPIIAYCDCYSGVSGDMLLGALVDAGLALPALRAELAKLSLTDGVELTSESVHRGTMRATKVHVNLSEDDLHCDFSLDEVVALIESSALSARVHQRSVSVFMRLAEAEARAHGMAVGEIRFHEKGMIDLIVDIVGTVIGLEQLGIERLYASSLPLGHGQINFSHSLAGILPLPSPTALELLSQARTPIRPQRTNFELVTPTGAALLTTLAEFRQPAMQLHRVGVGAGDRELPWPNILRLWLGTPLDKG